MDIPARLRRALGRLGTSIDQLEAAAARRAQADAARGILEDELTIMQDDRARLAMDLDAAIERGRGLDAATTEVSRRLERIEATVQALLGGIKPDRPAETA